ncbi:MAG: carboxypeptidase regulatory-like domain-containing protein, partial [Acidobacteriota bacterium]
MRKTRFAMAMLLVFSLGVAAWGQGTTSRVTGVITDPSGALVPGADVRLTNEATGISFRTVASVRGVYAFESLQVGSYTLSVELPGFKKAEILGIQVTIGQPTTANVTLQLGETSETVTVTGAYEIVQTSTSGNIGAIIEQKTLQDLPIVGTRGRNPLDLVNTQPGVVSGANTGGGVHVHGARDRAWNYTLDGIDTNETSAGGSNFSPLRTNPDSLAEFRVLTSNFTAEFGRNSGAQVTMITRSGGNEFHGSVFWFYRTPSFNANEWENNINQIGKRQFVQHIPGFSAGGPILKNRTFFFTNMQWLRARESSSTSRTVYTESARNGIFRYVKGGRNQPAGVSGASVDFSGNVLPGVNIGTYNVAANDPQKIGPDPTIKSQIALTPLPNDFSAGDGLNTAGFNFAALQNEKQYDSVIKIDHVLNSRNTIFGRYSWGHQNTVCDRANSGEPAFPGLPCRVDTYRLPRNLALNWRWSPTSLITNEFVFGINRFTFDFVLPINDAGVPYYSLNDITVPRDTRYGNKRRLTTYQFVDNFSYTRGSHSLRMGLNLRLQQHLDQRGSVGGENIAPVANFSTSYNTVSPSEFN